MTTETEQAVPTVRVERGHPTAEEIAAIAVVMFAAASRQVEESTTRRHGWSHRARTFNAGAVRGAGWGGGF